MPDQKSKFERRIEAARELATKLDHLDLKRDAQVIRDLCRSAEASRTLNATLHAELLEIRRASA